MIDFPATLVLGALLSAALLGSALLGWLGDLKRVGAATSARETNRRAAEKARPSRTAFTGQQQARANGARQAGSRRPQSRTSSSREQEERIRDAYFAKERKAREERERRRREQARTRRARQSASGGSRQSAGGRQAPPRPAGSEEARHRTVLELTGPLTPETVRTAYRRLIAAYHPDRVATLGIKLRRLAEEETKRINEAYAYFNRVLK